MEQGKKHTTTWSVYTRYYTLCLSHSHTATKHTITDTGEEERRKPFNGTHSGRNVDEFFENGKQDKNKIVHYIQACISSIHIYIYSTHFAVNTQVNISCADSLLCYSLSSLSHLLRILRLYFSFIRLLIVFFLLHLSAMYLVFKKNRLFFLNFLK